MNLVGRKAPSWHATVYNNGDKGKLSSEDLAGSWYVIYWWPFDFTGICNSEIVGFQSLSSKFEQEGIKLIGASCDSFHAHKQWFENTPYFNEETRPTHPIIADKNHCITQNFGFFNEELGCAYRGVVVVDPEGTVMATSCNQLTVARDPDSILTTATAFKAEKPCNLSNLHKIRN